MGTVAEGKKEFTTKLINNERSRPASPSERERLDAATFDADGNQTQTVFSSETIMLELPKEIYCRHSSVGNAVETLIDLSNATADVVARYFAEAVKIRVQMCTGFFASEGEDKFYVEATDDGLTGTTQEREGGARYNQDKFLKLHAKVKANTATDEELQYVGKYTETFKAQRAAALALDI